MDFGELYAYTAVDTYTREAQVVLLPGLISQDGPKALELVMAYFGSCEVLQTDGGKEFRGEFSLRSCKERRRWFATLSVTMWPDPIVPAGNEQAFVESFHRTLRTK